MVLSAQIAIGFPRCRENLPQILWISRPGAITLILCQIVVNKVLTAEPDDHQDRAAKLAHRSSMSERVEGWSADNMTRFGDLLIACILIALCLPLMAIVAVAIRLESPGPAFSRRARLTFSGRQIEILFFRTTAHEPLDASYGGSRHGQMTQVGGVLRFTRIDALPQLLNVLRGEMTLFGSGRISPDILDSQ